jgi:hypothetical protein
MSKKQKSVNGSRHMFTANVGGQPLNKPFLSAMKHYCKKKNVQLWVGETLPYRKGEITNWTDIPEASRLPIGHGGMALNDHCRVAKFASNPHESDPAAGVAVATKETVIIFSPKQTYKSIANMETLPRAIISTGSVNRPVYDINKRGERARVEHQCGAYIIEVKDCSTFFPRNIQALSDGSFIDLGVRYYPNGKVAKVSRKEIARVDGDDHVAEMDPELDRMLDRVQKEIPAHMKLSHDTWSMRVGNHHNLGKYITQARAVASGMFRVGQEADVTREFLDRKSKMFDEVVVVPSNHNEALDRMLDEGRYLTDNVNWLDGTVFSLAKYYGVNPVEFATGHGPEFMKVVEKYFKSINENKPADFKLSSESLISKVNFLKDGQSFKFGGIELGYHGDDGANGAKGSPKAMRQIHTSGSVSGHTHVPSLFNKNAVVGTGTHTPEHPDAPSYAKGKPSAWMNCFCFVYAPKDLPGEVGTVQLCNVVNYEYKLR